nr:gag pol polyprotein [Hymenolepis microstoma]
MFQYALSALPIDACTQVFGIVDKALKDTYYSTLKRTILSRLTVSKQKRLHQLFSQVKLGGRTSQLLRHVRFLAHESGLIELSPYEHDGISNGQESSRQPRRVSRSGQP